MSKRWEVRFIATVTVTEEIIAATEDEAMERATEMINNHEVGEHKLDLEWEVDDISLASGTTLDKHDTWEEHNGEV